jgi:hypothetical protein
VITAALAAAADMLFPLFDLVLHTMNPIRRPYWLFSVQKGRKARDSQDFQHVSDGMSLANGHP